jgi:hypothetical protein
MRNNTNIHDVVQQGRNPLQNPKDVPEAEMYLIGVGYTLAILWRIAGMNKVMIVLVEPWKTNRLQVQMWLVATMRLKYNTSLSGCIPRAIRHPFWKDIIIDYFHLAILAWEAPGRTGTIQDKDAIWTGHQPVKVDLWLGF